MGNTGSRPLEIREIRFTGCLPAEAQVEVVPDETIHVELLWHTPVDPDETDRGPDSGVDLDLHFAHGEHAGPSMNLDLDGDGKPDPWFDQPFDCFWFNPHPNRGSVEPAVNDDPGIDLDDPGGAGPENLNLNVPEQTTYRVGVHYWRDHGHGMSVATVRIYVLSQLQFEMTAVPLENLDTWDVAVITWPDGTAEPVTTVDGGRKITPDDQNPPFFQP